MLTGGLNENELSKEKNERKMDLQHILSHNGKTW